MAGLVLIFTEPDILSEMTTILKNSKSLTIQETRPYFSHIVMDTPEPPVPLPEAGDHFLIEKVASTDLHMSVKILSEYELSGKSSLTIPK